jgi:hypothetical protein
MESSDKATQKAIDQFQGERPVKPAAIKVSVPKCSGLANGFKDKTAGFSSPTGGLPKFPDGRS